MKYFKNTELAKLYNISEKSVRNWIEATESSKLNLQLYHQGDKNYVANTSNNIRVIEQLVEKGKKYKNTRGYKIIKPSSRFYDLYSQRQILDIVSSIDIHREIPHKYSYFDAGAMEWDLYSKRLSGEEGSNALKSTLRLLDLNTDYIDALLSDYRTINVIDIGVGNGMPAKGLLKHLLAMNKLGRYVAIDISQNMLAVAKTNVSNWFGNKVVFEGHVKDVAQDRFEDLTLRESFGDEANTTVNILLFLGGTISNLRQPDQALANIYSSMGKDDLLIFSKKPDTKSSRRYFDFATVASENLELDRLHRMIPDLLNLKREFYTAEMLFDEEKMARQIRAKLNVAVAIEFELGGKRRIVEINKDESLLLWRANHQSVLDIVQQFNHHGFELLQATKSPDQEYLLTISKLKRPFHNSF